MARYKNPGDQAKVCDEQSRAETTFASGMNRHGQARRRRLSETRATASSGSAETSRAPREKRSTEGKRNRAGVQTAPQRKTRRKDRRRNGAGEREVGEGEGGCEITRERKARGKAEERPQGRRGKRRGRRRLRASDVDETLLSGGHVTRPRRIEINAFASRIPASSLVPLLSPLPSVIPPPMPRPVPRSARATALPLIHPSFISLTR